VEHLDTPHDRPTRRSGWYATATWAVAWTLMLGLDGLIDLANLALILVLGAAVAAIWSAPWASMVASALAVLTFNLAFVPPRGTFTVDLHQHALLLVTMLTVSWIVALLMVRLRRVATQATVSALRSDQLRGLGDALRAADDPAAQASALQQALSALCSAPTTLLVPDASAPSRETPAHRLCNDATADEEAGLRLCQRDGRAMGPGTGRYEEQPAWYLPMRGMQGTFGAALVRRPVDAVLPDGQLAHAQALCDQLGAALERAAALRAAAAAREQAADQALRNTLLTAISHDHRTPLATILGASSALHDQGERLSAEQRRQLAATIVDEATQLSRLTDNTLQLARLGEGGLALQRDWESVEEMVGTVLRRVRHRQDRPRVKARLEPGLPLLRCDAVLMVQLLDNLVDNALKHGGADAPVEVMARLIGPQVIIAVRDRGPGIALSQQARIFELFRSGDHGAASSVGTGGCDARRGAGVGLALCRAIARAHGGDIRYRHRSHGGSSFEVVLPVEEMPQNPPHSSVENPAP